MSGVANRNGTATGTDLTPDRMTRAREVAGAVLDPEVPVLTIADLGVLRDVRTAPDGVVEVVVTPTYSGCPAMDAIRDDARSALDDAGFSPVRVVTVLSPAWTTDWMTDAGRRELAAYGIAPPTGRAPVAGGSSAGGPVPLTLSVRCPRCSSPNTRELSRFGSTACKSLWQCRSCAEPFDHFKAI